MRRRGRRWRRRRRRAVLRDPAALPVGAEVRLVLERAEARVHAEETVYADEARGALRRLRHTMRRLDQSGFSDRRCKRLTLLVCLRTECLVHAGECVVGAGPWTVGVTAGAGAGAGPGVEQQRVALTRRDHAPGIPWRCSRWGRTAGSRPPPRTTWLAPPPPPATYPHAAAAVAVRVERRPPRACRPCRLARPQAPQEQQEEERGTGLGP